jgi:AcrR family transcriptional regulator
MVDLAPAGEEQRSRILRAAIESIVEHGVDAVRLRDIARRAGVSTGMIQYYFESREDLLVEAFEWSSRELQNALDAMFLSSADPWAKIEMLFSDAIDQPTLVHHCKRWVELCAAASRRRVLRATARQSLEWWRRAVGAAIEEGIATKQFRPLLSQEMLTDLLVAALDGFELTIASEAREVNPKDVQTVLLETASTLLGVQRRRSRTRV